MNSFQEAIRVENRKPTEAEVLEICELLNKAFGQADYDEGYFYMNPQIFRFYCDTPHQDEAGYFMAFDTTTNKIIGYFVVGCRRYQILGHGPFKCGTPTMLAVDDNYQGKGIGKLMGTFVKNLYNNHHYFAGFQSFEDNSRGLSSVPQKNRDTFLKLKRVEKIYFRPLSMAEVLPLMNLKWYERLAIKFIQGVSPVEDARIHDIQESDRTQIIHLLNRYTTEMDFALVWDEAYLKWYSEQPNVKIKVFKENGQICGVLIAIILQFQIKGRLFPMASLENYRFQELSPDDQKRFLNSFLSDLKKTGAVAAVDYGFAFQPIATLRRARFLPQKRLITFFLEPHVNSEIYNNKPKNGWKIYAELR